MILALQRLLLAASLLTTYTASGNCLHGIPLHRRDNGRRVDVNTFGYTGDKSPLNWAALNPNNSVCATSSTQSPINLDYMVPTASVEPQISIPSVHAADLQNIGTTLQIPINGTTIIGPQTFNVAQFHFHTPSEHRINEEYYPLEMHLVSIAADGSGAIVAMVILFEVTPDGSTTDLLKGVIANLAQAIEPGSVASTGPLDFGEVIAHFKASEKYQYVGSGTTPPCVQGVNFFVSKKPMRLDVPTYRSLKNVLKFNSRYTQNTPGKPNLLQVASKQALAAGCDNAAAANLSPAPAPAPGVQGHLDDIPDACSGTSSLSCKWISH